MSQDKDVQRRTAAPLVPVEEARGVVARMVEDKLGRQGDTGPDAIFAQILNATDIDGLNAPWTGSGDDLPIGVELKIDSFRLNQSDYTDGLGWYAFVEGVNLATGEPFGSATGAGSVVVQLLQAETIGALPIKARVEEGRGKPGQKPPLHLVVLDSYTVEG